VATDRAVWLLASLLFLAAVTAAALFVRELRDDDEDRPD
jgi:uncharacterized membrane protein YqhA